MHSIQLAVACSSSNKPAGNCACGQSTCRVKLTLCSHSLPSLICMAVSTESGADQHESWLPCFSFPWDSLVRNADATCMLLLGITSVHKSLQHALQSTNSVVRTVLWYGQPHEKQLPKSRKDFLQSRLWDSKMILTHLSIGQPSAIHHPV